MSNIRKKVINKWDTGITTSIRSNDPETCNGAQLVKGFDVFKDSKKLVPMQSWEDFTTDAEKALNIRAMGGLSDTVYGLGSALSNWYGASWLYRIRVDVNDAFHLSSGLPLHLDMSTLPNDFWANVNSDMSDVRVTDSDGNHSAVWTENVDTVAKTGEMWIQGGIVATGTPTFTTRDAQTGTGTTYTLNNATDNNYAFAVPINQNAVVNYLTFNVKRLGNPGNLVVYLYSDSAGTPNAVVATLGTITESEIGTTARDISLSFADQTLSGAYHLVFVAASANNENNYQITYQSTGSITIKEAQAAGPTSWADLDVSATPNYTLSYFQNPTASDKHFYIYYGNSTATSIPYGTPALPYTYGAGNIWRDSSMRFAYNFTDKVNNAYYDNSVDIGNETFTMEPQLYVDGFLGRAARTFETVIETDNDDEIGLSGNDISFSFIFKTDAWEDVTLLADGLGYWNIALDTNGKIKFTVNGSVATTTNTSTIAVSTGEWHVIDCVFDSDAYIYIDGVKETFDIDDGDSDSIITNATISLNTGNYGHISNVWGFNNDLTENDIKTKYNNFIRSDFFSVGSQVALSSINKQYSGVQLYSKGISSGNWTEYTQSGSPVKSLSYYPMNGYISATANYFTVSNATPGTGFMYLAMLDPQTVCDFTHLNVGSINNSGKVSVQSDTGINGTVYFNDTGSVLNSEGDPGSASAFTSVGAIQSISPWKTYLGVGSNRRNEGFILIWDLASSNATDKVRLGTGNLRIVGNASDVLFGVVDNFIDDAIKCGNKPTMEIKQYVGDGQVQTTHVIEIPTVIDDSTYVDDWERAVSTFKLTRNFQTLFYARLPKTSAGTTFNEGLWSVGKNSDGQLALTLQVDTEGLGMPENIFGFAQQIFFIQKDGGIKKLTDNTYSNTALYTTLKMNEGNTEIEKKLIGIELVTEPLESGQTVSVYYKKNGDSNRTKIFDMTGENEITYETTYDINEANLPHYNEIEFDIESTGGKSPILELNYKYEYLSELV